MIHYDEYQERNLLKVASIVVKYNLGLRGVDPAEIVNRMKSIAQHDLADGKGYVATFGFLLCACLRDDGSVFIRAAIADHLFNEDCSL
jgi:hypothetical protein